MKDSKETSNKKKLALFRFIVEKYLYKKAHFNIGHKSLHVPNIKVYFSR